MIWDWKSEMKPLYFPPSSKVVEVEVPPLQYLMVHGEGDPNTSKDYRGAIEALYNVAYTLKFTLKKTDAAKDFKVGPLEGLWWSNEDECLDPGKKEGWKWIAMIVMPPFIKPEMAEKARVAAEKKKDNPLLARLKLEGLDEGRCAQILYIGPWAEEHATIQRVHDFIQGQDGRPKGKHHEIYMSDPRRVAPEKLKTVIRQPFV